MNSQMTGMFYPMSTIAGCTACSIKEEVLSDSDPLRLSIS